MRVIGTILIYILSFGGGCGDPYSLVDDHRDAEVEDSGTLDGSTMADSTLPDAGACGDGVRGAQEACDGDDLNGLDCSQLGFAGGTLSCSAGCELDTTGCQERCGNGTVEPGEDCDGANLAGQTCQSVGLGAGVLSCRPDCSLNLTGCPGCGNGVREAQEPCDGTDFGGASCNGGLVCTGQCHIDATGCGVPGTGTGADGSLFVDSTMELQAPLAASYSVAALGVDRATVDATADALAPGDEVLLINLQGSATDCGTVGVYEFLTVASQSGAEIVFQWGIQQVYGLAGGNTDLTGQAIVLQRVPNLSSLSLVSGGTLTAMPWNGSRGGILVLRVDGTVQVGAGSAVTLTGRGYVGGQGHVGVGRTHGRQGESICGNPQATDVTANHGGGGGGIYLDTSDDCGQGGGGAGYAEPGGWRPFTQTCSDHGATSPAANGGELYGVNLLPRWHLGSGGGSGATDDHANTSGTGGRGGGILVIYANSLVVDGALDADGTDGLVPSDYTDSGNGGGGSGGTLLIQAGALSGNGNVTVFGGHGPPAQNSQWNSPGGDGAPGRIRVDYQTMNGQLPGAPLSDWYLNHLCHPALGYASIVY